LVVGECCEGGVVLGGGVGAVWFWGVCGGVGVVVGLGGLFGWGLFWWGFFLSGLLRGQGEQTNPRALSTKYKRQAPHYRQNFSQGASGA